MGTESAIKGYEMGRARYRDPTKKGSAKDIDVFTSASKVQQWSWCAAGQISGRFLDAKSGHPGRLGTSSDD